MFKGKKAMTIYGAFFVFVAFAFVYILCFAQLIGQWSSILVIENNLTGFKAFLFQNLNLWIVLTSLIGLMLMAFRE